MPLATEEARKLLVERLGTRPLPEPLLSQALTHASYLNETDATADSNERLEFLGDAVLGMVVANELFRLFPAAGEGELTRMRADIVRGTTLSRTAARLDLGSFIILGRGEEAAGGRKRDRNLAGAMEAVIGAVYCAHGYRTTRALIMRLFKEDFLQVRKEGSRIDPKSNLQHLVQAKWHEPPQYVTVEEGSNELGKRFRVEVLVAGEVLGRGEGASKREAQQQAADEATQRLVAGTGD